MSEFDIFKCAEPVPFEEYKEKFKDWFVLTREDGILEVRMHTDDGPAMWAYGLHKGMGQLMKYIAQDLDNQVLIWTGSGDKWLNIPDMKYLSLLVNESNTDARAYAKRTYDQWYMDGKQLLKSILFDIEIPTIAAINGPSPVHHTELALACDITLSAPDVIFGDPHYLGFLVPGDGQYLSIRHLVGDKRASLMAYGAKMVDAETALDWGLISEIVPRENILDRAWELARHIMKGSYHARRLTHLIINQPWRKEVLDEFDLQFAAEGWVGSMTDPSEGVKVANKLK